MHHHTECATQSDANPSFRVANSRKRAWHLKTPTNVPWAGVCAEQPRKLVISKKSFSNTKMGDAKRKRH
jgi:hypothetical protein